MSAPTSLEYFYSGQGDLKLKTAQFILEALF